MIKAVLLDFYGTLVKEDDLFIEKVCDDIYKKSSGGYGVDEIGTYWYNSFLSICNNSFGSKFKLQREIELQSLKETILHFNSGSNAEELCEILFSYWVSPEPFENTRQVLDSLSLPICIVSNIDQSDLGMALNSISYNPEYIVTSESVSSYKPRGEMFEAALDLLDAKPSEVIHVGDSYSSDVAGASILGIRNIWVNAKNKIVGKDFKPDYVVSDIAEILSIIN